MTHLRTTYLSISIPVKLENKLSSSCAWLFRDPMDCVVYQAPLSMGFPCKNAGVGCHFLLQGIFPDQGSNLCLLYWQVDSLPLSHQGSPENKLCLFKKQCWNKSSLRALAIPIPKWGEKNHTRTKRSLIPSNFKAQYGYFIRLPGLGGIFCGSRFPLPHWRLHALSPRFFF